MDDRKGGCDHEGISPLGRLDLAVARSLAPYRDTTAVRVMDALGKVADGKVVLPLCGLALPVALYGRNRRGVRAILHIAGSVAAAGALKNLLKWTIARSRPNLLLNRGTYAVAFGRPSHDWNAMPSGHAAACGAVAGACAGLWPRHRAAAFTTAGALSLARLPPAKHYLSDVVVGFGLGILAATAIDSMFPPRGSVQRRAARRQR